MKLTGAKNVRETVLFPATYADIAPEVRAIDGPTRHPRERSDNDAG